MRYRAGERSAYLVRPVDDLTLIHHRPSGTTHVVAPIVVALLEVLHDRPLGVDEIVAALGERYDFSEDAATVAETIAARLEELANIDLIDRLP